MRQEDQSVQLSSFRVGSEVYAIDIMRIREIINPVSVTPVPESIGAIEGVINLRGVILPIIDLRKRFGLDALTDTRLVKYVIALVDGRLFGFRVDEVLDVVRVDTEKISPSPQQEMGREPGLFVGVCEVKGRLLLLLDLRKIIRPHERERGAT